MDEILRGVPAECQLGKQKDIGLNSLRPRHAIGDQSYVAVEIANNRVDLCCRYSQRPHVKIVSVEGHEPLAVSDRIHIDGNPMARSDQRLMRRFRDGDPSAVREVYDRFGRSVFVIALRSLGDRSLAEEAVQQTFLQAWRAAARFDPAREPGPWLYAIARRVAVDLYRRERRHQTAYTDDEPEIVALPPSFEQTWEMWEVRAALDSLHPDEQDVLRATHYLGLSHEEAAEHLGIPVGTVKSRSHRAHRKLAGLLAHTREATA